LQGVQDILRQNWEHGFLITVPEFFVKESGLKRHNFMEKAGFHKTLVVTENRKPETAFYGCTVE
jgi:hypothetical protein